MEAEPIMSLIWWRESELETFLSIEEDRLIAADGTASASCAGVINIVLIVEGIEACDRN